MCVLAATSGSGPEREAARALDDDPCRPLPRSLEREAVLGERRGGPELLAPLERPSASIAQLDEAVPVTRGAQPVDRAHELVEVTLLDEALERRHTIGQG